MNGEYDDVRLGRSRSLSDLKEIGCKSAWPDHISPLFLVNRMTIDLQKRQAG